MRAVKLLSVAACLAVMPVAFGATVFHYHFDEKAVGTTLATNDEFVDAQGGAAAVVKKTGGSPTAPKIADGVPFKIYDPVAKTSYTSTGSFRSIPAGYGNQYYVNIPYRTGMNGTAFTVEGFFKQDPKSMREIGGMWNGKWSRCYFTQGDLWRFGVGAADFWNFDACVVMGTSVTVSNTKVPGASAYRMDDGLWHHVAVVYDGTDAANRTFRVYLDKQLVAEKTGCAEIVAPTGEDPAPIRVGSADCSCAAAFHGWIDEVRYSDVALAPAQFLERLDEYESGETLGWWRFENDVNDSNDKAVRYRFVSETGDDKLSLMTESQGKTVTVRKGMNLDIKAGAADLRASKQVCTVNTGHLVSPDSPLWLKSGFTIELFLKFDETLSGAEYLYGTGAYVAIFGKSTARYQKDDDKGLYLYVGDSKPDGSTTTYARYLAVKMGGTEKVTSLATEQPWSCGWHHVAVTYDPDALTLDVYNDYVNVLHWENCPKLPDFDPATQRPLNLLWTQSSTQTSNFAIDELRVTRGVLAPSQFLDLDMKTASLKTGDTLALWTFDTNFAPSNCHACIEGVPNVNKGGDSGAFITNEVRVGRTCIKDGASGKKMHDDLGSAVTSNSFVRLGLAKGVSRDSPAPKALTYEFFTRSKGAPASYNQFISLKHGLVNWNTYEWSIHQTGTAGNFTVDALASKDQVKPDYPCIADDKWHHVALSMRLTDEVENDKKLTEFKLYFDRRLVKSWKQTGNDGLFAWNGLLSRLRRGGKTKSGRGEESGIGYVGNIDELRLSYGALEPRDFLRQHGGGGVTILLK